MPSTISAGTTAGTAIAIAGDTTGNLAFQTNGTTTAMTITTAQNVGIGTTGPTYQLQVSGSDPRIAITHTTHGTWFTAAGWTGANDYSIVQAGVAEAVRVDSSNNLRFNSGYGSVAVAYGCRAWCSLNGTGTIAIRGSGNISSVTDIGTGNYQYNLANAMPDANYGTSYSDYVWGVGYTDNFQTTSFRSQTVDSTFVPTDPGFVQVAVFR